MQMDVFLDKRQFDDALEAFERAGRFRAGLRSCSAAAVCTIFAVMNFQRWRTCFERVPTVRAMCPCTLTCLVYRQRGRGDKVEQLLREMIDRGMQMTPFTALTLLKQMVSDGQLQVALSTLLMLDQPLVASADVVSVLLDAGQAQRLRCCAAGHSSAAVALFRPRRPGQWVS